MRWSSALGAGLILALAGCGELPHPFQPAVKAPPGGPGPRTALMIEPVQGDVADGSGLARAVAEALQALDVPAAPSDDQARPRYRIVGQARAGPVAGDVTRLRIDWHLVDPRGQAVAETAQVATVPAAAWGRAEAAVVKSVALAAADRIDRLIAPAEPAPAAPIAAAATPAAGPAGLAIGPITGAPGDGSAALARALAAELGRRGHRPVASGTAALVVSGQVTVSDAAPGQQRVALAWIVRDAEGREVGRVDQANLIRRGRLDGAWGAIAEAAAKGAAAGIAALVTRLEKES